MTHAAPGEYIFLNDRDASYSSSMDYYAGQADHPIGGFNRPQPSYLQPSYPQPPYPYTDIDMGINHPVSSRGRVSPAGNKELVVHAIEAAAAVLRDQALALREQIAENERLRSALRVRDWELHNFRVDQQGHGLRQGEVQSPEDLQAAEINERHGVIHRANQIRDHWAGEDVQNSLIIHPDARALPGNNFAYSSNGLQGGIGIGRSRQQQDGGFLQVSSPSARSLSPSRRADLDNIRTVRGGQANTQQLEEAHTSNGQELVHSAPRLQDEIVQLKQRLSDATMKEMQLVCENTRLEKRLGELRLTIEKYQQELVDAKARVVTSQQDVLEENAHLRADLRAAEQDQNLYASSLLPLLAEFHIQPATRDPHSIVSGIKALIQHFCDELRKEPLHSKQLWRTSPTYHSSRPFTSSPNLASHPPQSPEHHGLEIVPTHYSQPERPLSPASPLSRNTRDWEQPHTANQHHMFGIDNYSNNHVPHSYHGENADEGQNDESFPNNGEDSNAHGPLFSQDAPDKISHLSAEPLSPLSDATDEDPLPDIKGLAITGDAVLGNKIIASGFSINGTTLCHFQWVRHYKYGHSSHIIGAAQPEYVITADDIDTMLSLECTPMDDRNRKGEMTEVFTNNRNWITLENDMKEQINDYLVAEQAIFDVKIVVENGQDISFEPVNLNLKRSSYELRRINGKKILATDKYVLEASGNIVQQVDIRVGKDSQCAIITSVGIVHYLDCDENRARDLLVLTMREFIKLAIDKKRARKKSWLSKK